MGFGAHRMSQRRLHGTEEKAMFMMGIDPIQDRRKVFTPLAKVARFCRSCGSPANSGHCTNVACSKSGYLSSK